MPLSGIPAALLAATMTIAAAQPSLAQGFWEGVNQGLNQQLDSQRPRPERFFVEPGVYDAKVTSDGMNAYATFNGGPRIRTRLCFHNVQVDNVVLTIESVSGFNIGTITFSDGTECPISRLE